MKVLSSDSRIKILKSLNSRRKTVSELAAEFKLSKSTVHEHLAKLVQENLITKKENGNKWVYYELTSGGKDLIGGGGKKIILLLSSIVAAVLGTFSFMYSSVNRILPQSGMQTSGTEFSVDGDVTGNVMESGTIDITAGGTVGEEAITDTTTKTAEETAKEVITDEIVQEGTNEIATQTAGLTQTGFDLFFILGIILFAVSIILILTWLKSR